jgi:hypothetical protein
MLAGLEFTANVAVVKQLVPAMKVMVVVPALIPVTIPVVASIVALAVLLLVHVPLPEPVRAVVAPIHTSMVPVMAASAAFTVASVML